MHKWLRSTRIAFLISFSLHFLTFFILKGSEVYGNIYKKNQSMQIDLINIPQSSVLPSMFNKEIEITERTWTPIKRDTRVNPDISSINIRNNELPYRQLDTKIENLRRINVPSVNPDGYSDSFLSNKSPFSSNIGTDFGLSSSEKGINKKSGRSEILRDRKTVDSAKIIPATLRKRSIVDGSVSEKLQIYKDKEVPFVNALKAFGNNITNKSTSKKIDVTLILDISESMQDNIDSVRRHIYRLIDSFNDTGLDYTLGLLTFHYNTMFDWLGTDINIVPQMRNIEEVIFALQQIKVSGGERQLDALMKGFSKIKFRSGASRHFIFITDEYVNGTFSISDVMREAKRSKITIDVLGRDEPFQRSLAEQTGGLWMPIEITDMN